MALRPTTGTPFNGYLSLAPGSLGPTAIALFLANGQSYTLASAERLYLTSISISTNDSAGPLVTIDNGNTSGLVKLARMYVTNAFAPAVVSYPPGLCALPFGSNARASANAISASKTVEVEIAGVISRT
jgi:hypothetical protein